jgi:hypothetical protein
LVIFRETNAGRVSIPTAKITRAPTKWLGLGRSKVSLTRNDFRFAGGCCR